MRLPIYQIDAFSGRVFAGNPAAVCPLDSWPADPLLQAIAAENNLAETAFLVPEEDGFHLRWFTPTVEVDLCGHATLAAAWVVFHRLRPGSAEVRFSTRSGPAGVRTEGDRLTLDFPARAPSPCQPPAQLLRALGGRPREVLRSRDYLVVYATEAEVRDLRPDITGLCGLDCLGVIVTAPGEEADFVSRFFAPDAGIPEDPVTGSAHCTLAPYWAARLGRPRLRALQVSPRGGELWCEPRGDRVDISGQAALYLEGTIHVPDA